MAAATKTARWLVTGANRGIGLELVKQLVQSGHVEVVAACRKSSEGLTSASPTAIVEGVDVGDDGVEAVLAAGLGEQAPFDVVVNNAGMLKKDSLPTLAPGDLLQQLNVNSVGPVRVTQALAKAGKIADGAKLVFVSSILGSIGETSSGGMYGYRMSKAALNMAVAVLGAELPSLAGAGKGPKGTIVSAVHPGWVATDMGGERAPVTPADSAAAIIRHTAGLKESDNGTFTDAIKLEEPSVSVDVLRTVHAASMAVVPVDASEGFPLCLPAYPFAEDKEGHCEAAGDGVPGVAWVEHHAACLLALLASPYADHALVGVHGTAVLARRVAPLLRAHGTTPKSEHGSSAFAALEAQASFVLVHLRVLEEGLSGVGKCGDSAFKRRGAEASKALAGALAATSIAK